MITNEIFWKDLKVNEKLFTDPLGDIASCMIYVSVTKLYLYMVNLFFTDQVREKTDLTSSVIVESNDSKGRKRPKIPDKVYRETDLVQQYPILIDIFLDNDIINFILCDSIDMFIGSVILQFQFKAFKDLQNFDLVIFPLDAPNWPFEVYFYSSRFQSPEKEVGLANFWIPTFQFLMAFIPGTGLRIVNQQILRIIL